MVVRKKGVSSTRPRERQKIIFLRTRQKLTHDHIHAIHERGLNIKDFSIHLSGMPKTYDNSQEENFSEPGVEYQMSAQFIRNLSLLSNLNSRRPILIHMKTCGGYWEEGMAIYDAIRACPNPVTILSYTHARSMSSIILQAADKRVLMPNSYFLFHEGDMFVGGTQKKVIVNVEWSKKVLGPTMLAIYTESLKQKGKYKGWSEKRIKEMLQAHMDKKEDVFLTAQEAVEWGFADEVFGSNGVFDWASLRFY
ncbi:MAG: ATP-dependent Clp protease proteolytic subunit [Patescibacteria group bacterium]